MAKLVRKKSKAPDTRTIRSREAKRAMTLSKEIGLTEEERHELATMLTSLELDQFDTSNFSGSWTELQPHHFDQLFDYLYGYHLVSHLLSMRDPNRTYKKG